MAPFGSRQWSVCAPNGTPSPLSSLLYFCPERIPGSRVVALGCVSDLPVRGKNMRQALLLNPFDSNPEPAQIVNRRATRSTPVCSNCQSDDIISHAVAQWSNESQEWQLASTFDQPSHCKAVTDPAALSGCRSIKPAASHPTVTSRESSCRLGFNCE